MERVKLPDAARRRTKALHAGAVDNLIFFQFSRKKTNLTLLKEKKGSRLLPDNSTDVSVVRI